MGRAEAVVLAWSPWQDRHDPAGELPVRIVDHEDARSVPHFRKTGIAHEAGAVLLHADAAEHPGRAAGGEPLLHVRAFQMLAGHVGGVAGGRLHRHQEHRLRLAGSLRGRRIVVDPLHCFAGRIASE